MADGMSRLLTGMLLFFLLAGSVALGWFAALPPAMEFLSWFGPPGTLSRKVETLV